MTKYSFFPKYWQKFHHQKNHWHHPLDDDYDPVVDENSTELKPSFTLVTCYVRSRSYIGIGR
jgi:hypothetical protein